VANEVVSIKSERILTQEQYAGLADVPPKLEWFANITNAKMPRYRVDVAEFMTFTGLPHHTALRSVLSPHVIA
jgi:integrase/recombinase XerD